MKLDPCITPYKKKKLRMDYVKAKAIKLLEENGVNLCHLGVDSAFLAMHHQSLKRKKKGELTSSK